MVAVKLPLGAQALDLLLELADLLAHLPAVDLELGLARTASRCASAKLARKVGPRPGQTGELILVRGELNLQLTFASSRALRKHVEDDLRAVDNREFERLLKVSLLG